MPTSNLDAIFFISTAPVIEYGDGLFHVRYKIGRNANFEIVMPPRVFMAARVYGSEIIAKWRLGELCDETNVVGIRKL